MTVRIPPRAAMIAGPLLMLEVWGSSNVGPIQPMIGMISPPARSPIPAMTVKTRNCSDAGDEPREREGQQLVLHRVDTHRHGGGLGVTDGAERAAHPAPVEVVQ